MRKEFTRVTIDTETYDRLTELAFADQRSRAGYLRHLIDYRHKQFKNQKPIPLNKDIPIPTLAQAIIGDTGDFKVVIEEQGQIVEKYLRDLPLHQRVVTQIYASQGKTIAIKKWVSETLAALPLEGIPKGAIENIQIEK